MPEDVRAHPVSGVDYPATYQQLQRWFPDDAASLDYLVGLRWPGGFVCPACAHTESWRTKRGLWMCRGCGRKTSVTAGTIFHRTRTPLSTWFAAIWFVTSQKTECPPRGRGGLLGFGSYETAWAWMHKLRRAMVRPDRDLLTGTVEVDETFVGDVAAGLIGASTDKVVVQVRRRGAHGPLDPHRPGLGPWQGRGRTGAVASSPCATGLNADGSARSPQG